MQRMSMPLQRHLTRDFDGRTSRAVFPSFMELLGVKKRLCSLGMLSAYSVREQVVPLKLTKFISKAAQLSPEGCQPVEWLQGISLHVCGKKTRGQWPFRPAGREAIMRIHMFPCFSGFKMPSVAQFYKISGRKIYGTGSIKF